MKKAANEGRPFIVTERRERLSTAYSILEISSRAATASMSAPTEYGANSRQLHDHPWPRKPWLAERLRARRARHVLLEVVAHNPGFRELACRISMRMAVPGDAKLHREMRAECGEECIINLARFLIAKVEQPRIESGASFGGKRYFFTMPILCPTCAGMGKDACASCIALMLASTSGGKGADLRMFMST